MAGRTSGSFGVVATIVVLSLLTLGMFVAFAVYFGKHTSAVRELTQYKSEQQDIVGNERNRDDVRALIEDAKKSEQKSLVGYLVAQREKVMERITGDKRDSLASIETKLGGVQGAEGSLISQILNQESTLNGLRQQLSQAEEARAKAVTDLQAEVARLSQLEAQHKASVNELSSQIGQYRSQVEEHGQNSDRVVRQAAAQIERIKNDAAETEKKLSDQISDLTEKNLVLEAQLAALRGERSGRSLSASDETALVDGSVINVSELDRSVLINIGRDRKVVLGMTFAIYANAGLIKQNEKGEYARGKADVEVIQVNETTSVCRITRELRGNPIVKGDVIANAIFDPNKQYKFVVYGNFDADNDGVATAAERADVEALIVAWGGKVNNDLQGDVDFLVLGEQPLLPPRPAATDPLEVIQEFQRRLTEVNKYNDMNKQAVSTAVPVLNENRLLTLIGRSSLDVNR